MREKEFMPFVKDRLGIDNLNQMQRQMLDAASINKDIILLSPTGSGKTLAFILPMLKLLKPSSKRVQVVIIAPSRELVIQIYTIVREIAPGYKSTPLYGGHKVEDEIKSLLIVPDIIVATPGRLLDHIHRRNIDVLPCRVLVLDEFDKSLEFGFEKEMSKIMKHLKNITHTMLTSATDFNAIPDFVPLPNPVKINYLNENASLRKRVKIHEVRSDAKDKLESLLLLLNRISSVNDGIIKKSIVFVNHRESAVRISNFLRNKNADVALYHGAMEQSDREKAVEIFNNGTTPILVATDLASRGLDIEGVDNIVHYHFPITEETYIHRNGRTARVDNKGDIYILLGPEESLPEFINIDDDIIPDIIAESLRGNNATLHITGGRKEKISRGDIVGFLIAQGGLVSSEIGKINVHDHYSLVAVPRIKAKMLVNSLAGRKIKGMRHKISLVTV